VFLFYRTPADGIRLHAAALVVAIATGVPEIHCILVLAAAMILTLRRRSQGHDLTDVVQMFVYRGCSVFEALCESPRARGSRRRVARPRESRVLVPSLDPDHLYVAWASLGVF
jgi:hypothetical protein